MWSWDKNRLIKFIAEANLFSGHSQSRASSRQHRHECVIGGVFKQQVVNSQTKIRAGVQRRFGVSFLHSSIYGVNTPKLNQSTGCFPLELYVVLFSQLHLFTYSIFLDINKYNKSRILITRTHINVLIRRKATTAVKIRSSNGLISSEK